jgi:acetolactate synthase-1/2/3 large subunit
VDLLYDEQLVRAWYEPGSARASFGTRIRRWWIQRHVNRLFDGGPHAHPQPRPQPLAPSLSGRGETYGRPLRAAAALLAGAERPILLVGSQAVLQVEHVSAIAAAVTTLGIPTYLSGMARGLLGRSHPLLLRHARRPALREADLVILAGVPCDFRLDYGRHINRAARVIAANRSAAEARRNRRPDVLARADAGAFLEALATDAAPRPEWGAWLAALARRDADRDAEIERPAAQSGAMVNPLALLREVDRQAADNATFVLDGGDFAATASYMVRPRAPLHHLDPGVFGTLGAGGGFALGAKLARPESEVWILYGDGAAAYSLAELDTCVRHGLPVIAVVGNDASWEQIAREQREMLHDEVGTVLRRTDYHVVAEGYGAVGILARRTDEVGPALERARAEARGGRPALVNVWLKRTEFRKGSISI